MHEPTSSNRHNRQRCVCLEVRHGNDQLRSVSLLHTLEKIHIEYVIHLTMVKVQLFIVSIGYDVGYSRKVKGAIQGRVKSRWVPYSITKFCLYKSNGFPL